MGMQDFTIHSGLEITDETAHGLLNAPINIGSKVGQYQGNVIDEYVWTLKTPQYQIIHLDINLQTITFSFSDYVGNKISSVQNPFVDETLGDTWRQYITGNPDVSSEHQAEIDSLTQLLRGTGPKTSEVDTILENFVKGLMEEKRTPNGSYQR